LNIFNFCSIILNILDFFNGYFLNIRHFIYSIFFILARPRQKAKWKN
jgi:hypothetical protein